MTLVIYTLPVATDTIIGMVHYSNTNIAKYSSLGTMVTEQSLANIIVYLLWLVDEDNSKTLFYTAACTQTPSLIICMVVHLAAVYN